MRIVRDLGLPGSNKSAHAVMEVVPGESSDVDEMLHLLDGEKVTSASE